MRADGDRKSGAVAAGSGSRALLVLAAANFACGSAGMVIGGLVSLIASDLHWSAAEAGRLIGLYMLGFAVFSPLLGALLGSVCRKRVVIAGLLLVGAGSVVGALVTQPAWLQGSRLLVAAGGAMAVPSVSAIASYLFPERRQSALAMVLMGMTVAVVLGVPLGTLMAGSFGWRTTLAASACVAAAAALAVKWGLPGGIVVPPTPLAAWGSLLRDAGTYRLLAGPTVLVCAVFCLYAYIAPFLNERLGVDTRGLSLLLFWYGAASLAANAVLGRISDRVGAPRLFAASMAMLTCALAAAHLGGQRTWLVVVVLGVMAVSSSFLGTLQQARVADAAPTTAAALLALNTSSMFAGQAAGAFVGGEVMAHMGLPALPGVAATIAAIGMSFVWLIERGGAARGAGIRAESPNAVDKG